MSKLKVKQAVWCRYNHFLHLICPACYITTASGSQLPWGCRAASQLLPGSNSWQSEGNGNLSNCVQPVWLDIDFTRMNSDSRFCQKVDWWLIPLTAGRSFKSPFQQRQFSELTFRLKTAIILRISIQWRQFLVSALILDCIGSLRKYRKVFKILIKERLLQFD